MVGVAAYLAYSYGFKSGSNVTDIGDYLNQSMARVGKCQGGEVALGDICEGGTTSAGGYTFCWGPGGTAIKCYR